jgi:hypothetical protein
MRLLVCSKTEFRKEFVPDRFEAGWERGLVGRGRGVFWRFDEVEVAGHEVDAAGGEVGGQDVPQLMGTSSVGAAV